MRIRRNQNQKRGQTMMEYVVMVALIAIASIPIIKVVGDVLRANLIETASALSGENAAQEDRKSMVEGGKDDVRRSLKNFHHSR